MTKLRRLTCLFLLTGHLCAASSALSQPPKAEEVDPLAIATVLLKAGQLDKAKQIFDQQEVKTLEPKDKFRLLTLRAEYHLQKKEFAQAEPFYRQALPLAEDKDLIRLKLIKNLFLQKKPAKVLYEIVLLSPATRNQPLPLQFEAEAYFLTGKLEKGLAVLARAAQTHPNEIRFPLKRIVVLAEQQLAQTAIEEALALLDHPECRPENILQVAQIFSNRQDWRSAVLLLEGARLRLFNTPTVAKALAFNYSQMGKFKLAGEVLYQSGLAHDEINLQSAELFRKAGHYNRAEWMNAQVADQGKKLKQRFGMLLQTKSFESAAALGPRLRRNGLLKEGQVQYGLAYAYFQTGQYRKSQSTLQHIRDDAYFEDAARLLQVVGDCIENPVSCN